ncbi:hypothetical protein C8F04DRAFT_1261561 [Mycena alexandri]|uniref:Uncharacterized protein n=1 Tax=Mycena alexandri TaxID=1745969 RepID=A0AAD6SU76_9AGAR|nr:hypothetical protein C8F04DRAFT_1261561 [Mycena alexandri]
MKITETATTIVSLLGGPELNAEDIDWALDVPAGQRLLEWLVSQVELPADSDDSGTDKSDTLRAALGAIALEEDEVQMFVSSSLLEYTLSHTARLRNATRKTPIAGPTSEETVTVPAGYTFPWRLRAKEEYLVSEATRLETETESLKSRLQQTKVASQSLTQAIKFLASEIEKADGKILGAQDRLSELSLQADATLLAAAGSGLGLLDGCALIDLAHDESALSAVTSARTTIIDRFKSQMRDIDAAAQRLPTVEEIQAEGARLDAALRTAHGAEGSLDVPAELEAAWARDQAALLEARHVVLDESITMFSETLLPPLTALHDDLTATDAHLSEARALVGALQEELQDIVDDVSAQESPETTNTPSKAESKDVELQTGLTSLLKQLKDLRPPNAPPLVLLGQEDILSELQEVYAREEVSLREEEAWIANLLPSLRNLQAETAHAPLLDVIYAHSLMNTSPPFASPADVRAVQTDAKNKADDLGDAIAKVQEDVKTLSTDRAKRRMEHFVAKWAKQ